MEFNIYGTTESADTNPKREWKYLVQVKGLKIAEKTARRLSKFSKWHEIELEGFDDEGQKSHHSYWRKGKIFINMGL